MKIVDYFRKLINRIKNKNQQFLLESPKNDYKNLIKSPKIDNIIKNIPENLSETEKAYYIYLELGKILSEDPQFVFTDRKGKEEHYNDSIDENYYGICKSISELYVSILNSEPIGIEAELVKKYPDSPITHIDTILNLNGKKYIANLISDLSRIKTSRRVNSFGFDLSRTDPDPIRNQENMAYLERLEQYYGKIESIPRADIEKLDKKLNYSTFLKDIKSEERGVYTDDVIKLLSKEMNDTELFKKYVLKEKDVSDDEILKYKLDYIFENVDKFTDYKSSNINYLENIRYYLYIARKVLSPEEGKRIQAYVATRGDDVSNIISIIKVRSKEDKAKKENLYYLYSSKDNKYINKSNEEIIEFLNDTSKDTLHIIGTFDRFNPRKIDELDLER